MTVTAGEASEQTGARRALIGSGLLLALAVGFANALNAVFQFALARILERGEYSLLAALFAVVLIGAVPPLAFQATTARSVASSLAEGRDKEAGTHLRGTLRSVLVWTAALLVLTAVLVPIGAAAGLDEPAGDRGDGGDGRHRPRDPGRLGRPAGRAQVPRPGRRHAALRRHPARRRARDRRGRRQRRGRDARRRGRDGGDRGCCRCCRSADCWRERPAQTCRGCGWQRCPTRVRRSD